MQMHLRVDVDLGPRSGGRVDLRGTDHAFVVDRGTDAKVTGHALHPRSREGRVQVAFGRPKGSSR